VHQEKIIGQASGDIFAALAATRAQADSIKEHILSFIEGSSEAEIVSAEMET
jgi:uncharacterized protein YlxP (DUF503 family)